MPGGEPVAGDAISDLDLLVAAAKEAGALAMSFFGRDPRTWTKAADSLVSEADIAVDELLTGLLRTARPAYGWLSEETEDSGERHARARVFVVDPIDGTRAFVAGRLEWAVSLAVVENGRPIAAVLFAPALEQLFRATSRQGAERNGVPLRVSGRTALDGARFAGPRRYARDLAALAGRSVGEVRFVPSLAYRFALVAAGEVDVAVARPGAHDWDLAAADLLVHEAGGRLIDPTGERLRYNRTDHFHPALVAATPELCDTVAAVLAGTDRPSGSVA